MLSRKLKCTHKPNLQNGEGKEREKGKERKEGQEREKGQEKVKKGKR